MKEIKMAKGERHEPTKTLHRIEIRQGESGGHIITHHFKGSMGSSHDPEEHVFGPDEGHAAMEHIKGAANIVAETGDADPEHSAKQNEEDGENG